MCGPYWSQWDKSDLDSWQGKDLVEEEDDYEEEYSTPYRGCTGCHGCMDCLGMSDRDFM